MAERGSPHGQGGAAGSDGGPNPGASGLGGAGGKASADGGNTSVRDAHDGDMQAGGASGADSGGGSPYANFATIRDIVLFKCGGAGCHSGEREPRLVDEAKLYSTLTTYVAPRCGNRLLVKPGSPEESAFYLAQNGLCGTNLPKCLSAVSTLAHPPTTSKASGSGSRMERASTNQRAIVVLGNRAVA